MFLNSHKSGQSAKQHMKAASIYQATNSVGFSHPDRQPRERAPDYADQAPAAHTIRVCSDSAGNNTERSFPQCRLTGGRSHQPGNLRPAYILLSAMRRQWSDGGQCRSQFSCQFSCNCWPLIRACYICVHIGYMCCKSEANLFLPANVHL